MLNLKVRIYLTGLSGLFLIKSIFFNLQPEVIMKKLIVIALLMSGIPALAQTDKIDSLLNDLVYNDSDHLIMPEKPVKFDFLYTGANYSSNTFYAGREIGSDMFNITGNLFYYSSTGLFIGASGCRYDQLTPSYSNTTVSAGYSKAIDKKKLFTIRTSYSRFFYYKPDTASYFPYKNNFNLGLSFRKNWIGLRVSGNLLFGEEFRINVSTALYSRFTLIKLGKYNKIYTAPEVSAFFTTETVSTTKTNSQNADQTTNLKDVFSLLNTQIYVPLGLSVGNFDFEFSYSLNLPTTQDVNISYPAKTFYSVSIGYMLPIAKK